MSSRREYLTTLGAGLAAVSGCVTHDGTGDATTSTTIRNESPDSATETPTGGIVVEDVVVRKAVTYDSVMGSGGVLAGDGQQYVVATVRSVTDRENYQFTFENGEESFEPGLPDTVGAINVAVAGHEGGAVWEQSAVSDSSPYYLAFTVPSPLDASDPVIRHSGEGSAEWDLPEQARTRLVASEPRFELDSLDVPEEVSQGEPLAVSLTVRNVSETGGRFLAAAYWPTGLIADDDESHLLRREVAAGETATTTTEIETRSTAREDGPVTLSIAGHVNAERSIRLHNASTPS